MKVLAIGAHPDDVELGAGATLSRLVKKGAALVVACVTAGEQGTPNVANQAKLAATRRREAEAGAKALGAKEVRFLGLPDGLTAFTLADKIAMIALLRDVRPDWIFVHAKADTFPDHAVVHALTMAAVVGAAGPWYADASGAPHAVANVLGYEVWHPIPEPTLLVSCGSSFSTKMKALSAHVSQTATLDYVAAAEGLARYRGALAGTKDPVEAFEVLRWSGAGLGLDGLE